MTIHDVARDGRWLTTRDDNRYGLMVHTPDWREERDLSWLEGSVIGILSQDGQTILFCESADIMGTNYAVCLRKTDGTPVVRLGEGSPMDLSADGKWALAVVLTTPPQLMIYPTGAGESRRLERGGIENYSSARWFPNGRSILICGNEAGKATRFYVQDLAGGPPQAVTPEGTRDGLLSPDGKLVLARGPDRTYFFYSLAGGEPRPVPWLAEADGISRFGADGRSVLVSRGTEIPRRIERVDLQTGERALFKEIAPADRAGLLVISVIFVTDDERSYTYTAVRTLSTLFVVEGGK